MNLAGVERVFELEDQLERVYRVQTEPFAEQRHVIGDVLRGQW